MRSSAYFRRSAMAAASRFSGPTAWVLLDEFASIGECRNATTATGQSSAGRTVHVSFEPVDPPGISRWFVHCPVLDERRGLNGRPQILNAADTLVLMRMAFFSDEGRLIDYFVYRAGPGKPSLDLIPGPYPGVDVPKQIGILPCGDGFGDSEHYCVVFPAPQFEPRMNYEIFVFSSESRAWSCKVPSVSNDRETSYAALMMHSPTKAIAAGGGSLAWIDLSQGVLLCNVLDDDPVLRLIQWPVLPPSDVCIDTSNPLAFRDAMLSSGGVIRFVELKYHENHTADLQEDATNHGWMATVWERKTTSVYWKFCFKADVSNIMASDSTYSFLRRKIWVECADKVDLNRLVCVLPILSLQNEDVLYILNRLHAPGSSEALLLAVNAREERLEAIEQVSFRLTCSPCTFSRFLNTNSGTYRANPPDRCANREKMERVGTYLLAALNELKDIEKHVQLQKPSYSSSLLLCSGPSSSLHTNIDAGVKSGSMDGQNAVIDAVNTLSQCLRLLGDIEPQILAPIEAMKSKIGLALGTLDN